MENASKALIIAGAILLSILLITLGIYIFQQAQATVNDSGMSEAEIQTFNSKFIKYEGEKVKGSSVKSLIQEVNVNNAQDESSEGREITLSGDSMTDVNKETAGAKKQYKSSDIKNTKTYEVKITGYGAKGRVNEITITENTN